MRCDPEQIVVTAGTQQAIDICNGKVVVTYSGTSVQASGEFADAPGDTRGLVRLRDAQKGFLGLGTLSADGTLRAERLLSTQSV